MARWRRELRSTPRARGGGGDGGAAQCRWGRSGDEARQHAAGRDGGVPRAVAVTPGAPPAAGERVAPGLGGTVGRLAAPGTVACGALCPRALACGAIVGGRSPRAVAGHAEGRMRRRGRAATASVVKVYVDQNVMKKPPPQSLVPPAAASCRLSRPPGFRTAASRRPARGRTRSPCGLVACGALPCRAGGLVGPILYGRAMVPGPAACPPLPRVNGSPVSAYAARL